jgi:PAS domain S-box-containing protein
MTTDRARHATGRLLASAAARQAHLAAIVEVSADAILSTTLDGCIESWNTGATRMFGYEPDEIIGRHVTMLMPPADAALLPARFAAIQTGAPLLQEEVGCVRKGGTIFPALLTVSPMFDKEGRVVAAAAILHDIGERKRIQRALIESEAEYHSTFNEAPVGIGHTSLDGRWLRANPRLRDLLGYPDLEERQINFRDLTHPSDLHKSEVACRRLLAGEIAKANYKKRYRRRNGDYCWCELTVTLHRDTDGRPQYFIAVVEDISQKKQTQDELAHLLNLSPDMIMACDFQGRITHVNDAWRRVLGYAPDELCDHPFILLVHPDDHVAAAAAMERLVTGHSVVGFTNRCRAKDGTYRYLEWHAKGDGASATVYAVARDQTEHRLLEEQFAQAQKMEAVGRLAGGVAHDFNNLLTAILGFSTMTHDALEPGDPRREDMEEVLKAGRSAAALTGQLLAFSRKQILAPQQLDLRTVIVSIESLLHRVIGEDIALVIELPDDCCCINADRGQLEQAIMNLAVNARDAMPHGGTLEIAAALTENDAAFVAEHPGSALGPHVLLTVTDTGSGIAPDALVHMFEPFFTTKEQGKGTGLGLATVYGVVKQSGGYIDVENVPGYGASFRIRLPRVAAAATDAAPVAPTADRAPDSTETILLVEDQPEVRRVAKRALEAGGYRVLEAADGVAALECLQQPEERIQLLLTDVVMPTMSGRQLANAARAIAPSLQIVFMSGYTDDAIVREGIVEGHFDFIRKPFLPADLLARVREVRAQAA